MSQPFKLFRLQQIDSQLDQIQARLQEIETSLGANEELRQAEAAAAQAEQEHKAAQKALHQAEEEVRAQRIKIEQTEAALYGGKVRNPKELQDLQNESAALKRHFAVLEDRQLEAMLGEEDVRSAAGTAASQLELVQARTAMQRDDLLAEREKLQRDIQHTNDERQAAASSIPEPDLKIYQQLRKIRRGVAVAKVVNGGCSACGTILNAALLHAAHSPNQISRCDTCQRILYAG